MTFTELKERTCKALEGEVTLSKVDFCLLGAVLLLGKSKKQLLGESALKLASVAAGFLGKQMEQ